MNAICARCGHRYGNHDDVEKEELPWHRPCDHFTTAYAPKPVELTEEEAKLFHGCSATVTSGYLLTYEEQEGLLAIIDRLILQGE